MTPSRRPGTCITSSIWFHRKQISQWQWHFWKLCSHWLRGLKQQWKYRHREGNVLEQGYMFEPNVLGKSKICILDSILRQKDFICNPRSYHYKAIYASVVIQICLTSRQQRFVYLMYLCRPIDLHRGTGDIRLVVATRRLPLSLYFIFSCGQITHSHIWFS